MKRRKRKNCNTSQTVHTSVFPLFKRERIAGGKQEACPGSITTAQLTLTAGPSASVVVRAVTSVLLRRKLSGSRPTRVTEGL